MSAIYQISSTELSAIIRREIKAALKEVQSDSKSKLNKTHCSVTEAKSILSLSKTKIYELIASGTLAVKRAGSKYLIDIESIHDYLNK